MLIYVSERKKFKMKNILTVALLLLVATTFAQVEINGVKLAPTLKAGAKTLTFNGGGIRKKFGFSIYVGALYLPSKSKDGNAIAKANEAQSMRIAITSGLITSAKFVESTKEGFQKSTGGNTAPIQAKIDKFLKLFMQNEVVDGDVYDLTYLPAEGVKVYRNGKQLDVVQGLDFKTALFGIWLGNNPADAKLKTGLLGS
jgi:hypothetical protein